VVKEEKVQGALTCDADQCSSWRGDFARLGSDQRRVIGRLMEVGTAQPLWPEGARVAPRGGPGEACER